MYEDTVHAWAHDPITEERVTLTKASQLLRLLAEALMSMAGSITDHRLLAIKGASPLPLATSLEDYLHIWQ